MYVPEGSPCADQMGFIYGHKSKFTLDCQAGFGCPSLSKNDSGVERTMSYCAWAILPMTVRYCAKVGDSQPYSLKSFQYQNDSGEQYSGHFPCNCARELKHRLFPEPVGCTSCHPGLP